MVLTDQNNDNVTDLVLSKRAFFTMALNGKGADLLNLGVVDVEYKRYNFTIFPCVYIYIYIYNPV